MSIPLDRLYHYIENIAKKVRGDDVVIYRFYPHGSKKIEDLTQLSPTYCLEYNWKQWQTFPIIHCHDQEPLNFKSYQNIERSKTIFSREPAFKDYNLSTIPDYNLTMDAFNINDKSIILHSEQRSINVDLYQNSYFVPVYYWAHALISLDWFRYAQYETINKSTNTTRFLIYNRAWSNTREYRLKFLDLLIDNGLVDNCRTSVRSVEPELNVHYQNYDFKNPHWQPHNKLETYYTENAADSHFSADFDITDYNATDIEIVLETLFDDSRLHLTEKSLRPIACKQPFILAATPGSLEYLRNYGFKTFNGIIDESYDLVQDPVDRMFAIVSTMKKITSWNKDQYNDNMKKLQEIAEYNQQHFFSKKFFDLINDELTQNLKQGFDIIKNTNTGRRYIEFRKILAQHEPYRLALVTNSSLRTRKDVIEVLKIARQCQYKNL
jgi:hypothetical protein